MTVSADAGAPVLVAFEAQPAALERVGNELRQRYGRDYEIVTAPLPSGPRVLASLVAASRDVVFVLAGAPDHADAVRVLAGVRGMFPTAKRCVTLNWGDRSAAAAILGGFASGDVDYWVTRPWGAPDESFHRAISEFLAEWSRLNRPAAEMVRVVGRDWDGPTHQLRDLLSRQGIPYGFLDAGSTEGALLLDEVGANRSTLPVAVLMDGSVLVRPSGSQIGAALGLVTTASSETFDVAIVGAGPAGLAAAVYASSEGLKTAVVEREAIGGQAGTSSLIRNYLGFPRGISGAELAQRAYEQAWSFGTEVVYGVAATGLRRDGQLRELELSDGSRLRSRAVVLATGVSYRRIDNPELDRFHGAGVFYGAAVSQASVITGQDVTVVGGGNSAGQAASFLAAHARQVTLLVRGGSLADSMSDYLIRTLRQTPNIDIRYHAQIVGASGEHRLQRLQIRDTSTGAPDQLAAAAVFVMIGAEPPTDWLPADIQRDPWGYLTTGEDTGHTTRSATPPSRFETSVPGVYAVGDVRHGATKRVASGVGEGSVVIGSVHRYLAKLSENGPHP